MNILTKQDILSKQDLKISSFHVPAWEGNVCLKPLTISQKLDMEKKYISKSGIVDYSNADFIFSIVKACVCDSDGENIFSKEDREVFFNKSSEAISFIMLECVRRNWGTSNVNREKKT